MENIYVIEVLNNEGEWVRDIYDVRTDIGTIKKLAEYYKDRGYTLNQVRIGQVI